jgi:hypothetical protein
MDRHQLWREVKHDYARLSGTAPSGYEPVVLAYLVGRAEPVEVAVVTTSRGHDYPWVRLEAASQGGEVSPGDYWVHAHESHIAGVEIRFRRTGAAPIGFRVEVADELPPDSD